MQVDRLWGRILKTVALACTEGEEGMSSDEQRSGGGGGQGRPGHDQGIWTENGMREGEDALKEETAGAKYWSMSPRLETENCLLDAVTLNAIQY